MTRAYIFVSYHSRNLWSTTVWSTTGSRFIQ